MSIRNLATRFLALFLLAGAVAPTAAFGAEAESAGVDFRFDQADLRLLVQLVSEVTGRRFILDDRVQGRVTVFSATRIPPDEVYPLFLSILEAHGFSVVDRRGVGFVVPLPERTTPVAPLRPDSADPAEGLATRIFKLQHVDAIDFSRTIEPMVPGAKTGAVAVFAASNHLVVTETPEGLERIAGLIEAVDRPGASRIVEIVRLEHASAEDLAQQLMAAMEGAQRAGARVTQHIRRVAEGAASMPSETLVVPAAQANSLLLVGSPVQIAELRDIIARLDVEPVSGHGRLHAVFLRYLSAEEAANSLTALLDKSAERDARQRISIEASAPNNALLVDASPRDFQWLRGLIDQLDQAPQQVLVEVLIAEVSVDSQLDLGVEWATVEQPAAGRTTVIGRSRPGEQDMMMNAITRGLIPRGLAVGVAHGVDGDGQPRLAFLLRALQEQRDVRILSNVPLWAQNNAEATVSVVDNIPILRSTIEGGAGVSRDIIQTIERMDVGIHLAITPHINQDREISLKLKTSIEAIISDGPPDTLFAPTIARREVSTTVTVPDSDTVVISGLMREDEVQREGRVPILGRLPLLGALFRYTTHRRQRNNLLIFVTPRLVSDRDAAGHVRFDLETRSGIRGLPPGIEREAGAGQEEGVDGTGGG